MFSEYTWISFTLALIILFYLPSFSYGSICTGNNVFPNWYGSVGYPPYFTGWCPQTYGLSRCENSRLWWQMALIILQLMLLAQKCAPPMLTATWQHRITTIPLFAVILSTSMMIWQTGATILSVAMRRPFSNSTLVKSRIDTLMPIVWILRSRLLSVLGFGTAVGDVDDHSCWTFTKYSKNYT